MKLFNKILAWIVKPIDEYYGEIVEEYGWKIFKGRDLKRYIGIHFNNLLYAIYSKCPILEIFLKNLCELEMYFKIAFDKDYRDYLDCSDVGHADGSPTDAQNDIPKNSFYCSECPYYDQSALARLLFGSQCDGYCYYLGKGDFSFVRPTELLWDMCKECGINEFPNEDNESEDK